MKVTRRQALGAAGAAALLGRGTARGQAQPAVAAVVGRNDAAGSAASVAETLTASSIHPASRYRAEAALFERISLAAGFLERSQSAHGNVDLLTTNFNSPPDTGFVVHGVATAAADRPPPRRRAHHRSAAAVPGRGGRGYGRGRCAYAAPPLGHRIGAGQGPALF